MHKIFNNLNSNFRKSLCGEEKIISIEKSYEMAFHMLCKYADLSIGVRNGIFIQGIIVLSGSGYLMHQKAYLLASLGGLFCMFMVLTLHILHVHYNNYFFSVRQYIEYLEENYSSKKIRGYVDFVEKERDQRISKRFGWLKNHGSFVLIGVTSTILFTYNVFIYFQSEIIVLYDLIILNIKLLYSQVISFVAALF